MVPTSISLVLTEERKKETAMSIPNVVLFLVVTLKRNVGTFIFFGYQQLLKTREKVLDIYRRREEGYGVNAIRRSNDR